jgi:UDP-glucose:(heptosyl)LPS alpha-1,3-glucosyltransferase
VTTAVCGYSHYLSEYDCGLVIDEPFNQQQLDGALLSLLENNARRLQMRENGLAMAAVADIYALHKRAADIILRTAKERAV